MPQSRVTSSKPVLPDWDFALNFFECQGKAGVATSWGVALTYIKKFEKLKYLYLIWQPFFCIFYALYLFLLLITIL